MERVAHRVIAVAAMGLTGLTMGGAIAVLSQATSTLPDVQVRDFGLVAANVQPGVGPAIETVENHIRPDLSGGDTDHAQVGLADLLHGGANGTLGGLIDPNSSFSELTIDQNDLSNLLGGGLDPEAIRQALILDPNAIEVGTPNLGTVGGGLNVNDPGGANAASAAVASITGLVQSLPVAQQAFTSGVAAAELQFNSALTDAQATAVERFGADSNAAEFVNWMFNVNNSVVAQNEASLNSLLGINLDPTELQNSLVGQLAPGGAAAEQAWNVLMSLNPDEYGEIIQAVQANSFTVLLGNLDWSSLFPGLF